MRAAPLRRSTPRRLSWLLWLALLLPLAQGLALSHAYGHTVVSAMAAAAEEASPDGQSSDTTACGLCLAAAHLGAGAMPVAPAPMPVAASWQHWAVAAGGDVWPAQPPTPYLSRAPPFASC